MLYVLRFRQITDLRSFCKAISSLKAFVLLSGMKYFFSLIHTYIIDHYNPSVRIIDLVSHTTFVVCRETYSLKSTPNDRFFEKLFIYSQSFCQKSARKKSPKKYFSYFVLMSGLRLEPWLFV